MMSGGGEVDMVGGGEFTILADSQVVGSQVLQQCVPCDAHDKLR